MDVSLDPGLFVWPCPTWGPDAWPAAAPLSPALGPVLGPGPHARCTRRWLGYLGLLLLDVAICLLVLVGLIRSSKGILVG